MLEDPAYMLRPDNLRHLAPMVMCNSQDKHHYISLLFRIKNSGVHYILCEKLKHMSIRDEIPQFIEIMLRGPEDAPISHPIYKLLWFKAKKCLSFRIDLFLRLKSVLSTIDESKASYCYFLCCDILDIDRYEHKRNLKTLGNRLKFIKKLRNKWKQTGRTNFRFRYCVTTRTFSLQSRSRSPIFQGLMLFFAKAVASIFSSQLFNDLDRFSKVFNNKKNFKSLQLKSSKTKFKSNIMFLESMVSISGRLKKIPLHLRARTLAVELEILNHELCNDILNPFDSRTQVVNFLLDHAKALDSAENCPYIVLVECAYRRPETEARNSAKLRKARALRNQLESLNDLGDIGDVDGIRESLLNAMENILFGALRVAAQTNEKYLSNVDILSASKSTELEIRSMVDLNEVGKYSSKNAGDVDEPRYLRIGEAEEPTMLLYHQSDPVPLKPHMQVYFDGTPAKSSEPAKGTSNPGTVDFGINAEANSVSQENVKHNDPASNKKTNETAPRRCQQSVLTNESPQDSDEKEAADGHSNLLEAHEQIYNCDEPGSPQIIRETEKSSARIKRKLASTSRFASLPGWDIKSFIVKSGGVIKHEYIAYQILTQIKEIFMIEKLPIYIRNYRIILISDTSGLVETVQDAISIHRIKADNKFNSLSQYFAQNFAGENLLKAKKNFLHSLVGYSLASYLLQIKDRHNGNIMIDSFGHIIHVDFGFIFGKYPGILYLENAPFKFSAEYLELIDLEQFKNIFVRGFKILRKHREKLTRLVEVMEDTGYCDKFTFSAFLDRLRMGDSEREVEAYCHGLIAKSIKNMGTMFYDQIQYLSNGYL